MMKYSAILFILFIACTPELPKESPKVIYETAESASAKAKELKSSVSVNLAEGLKLDLWATDSLAPDPVAMGVDKEGNIYITRTNRQKNSEFDIRNHVNWMTASIGLQSVEDRREFLKKTFDPSLSEENSWMKDLNGDGSFDWKDLTVERDEVWKLEDTDADGLADKSTRVVNDFYSEISDVAGALLVRDEDMFVGIGPDMWRLEDKNNDGVMETKKSISQGYAVHIGFGGHGMSGAVEGPDGRIYWGIGDIGASITDLEGNKYHYPNQGVLVRSEPDGSNFEVFAAGLRNTHEFVFDEYGNIIGADNDGDHAGESERLVHIVEGSDQGWRTNWQFGKYTDPLNNSYKVWMEEKLYLPRWEGQAAYIIPPIQNFHNGPTGMIYNPGTALGEKWDKKFFLVEFVGTPSRSKIWSFGLDPSGASFKLNSEQEVLSGVLPTGIRFGSDGAMYIADWISGWDTKNYGRVWKLDVAEDENDLEELRLKTKELINLDYSTQSIKELGRLFTYRDMRVRTRAQFELVKRGTEGLDMLNQATALNFQLARIHGIWGLGQLERNGIDAAKYLVPLLQDPDAEIIAQTAKVLGDLRYNQVESDLELLLAHPAPRVKFYAAEALGRLESQKAIPSLFKFLEKNNDEDVYLRHAAVLALSRIGAEKEAASYVENSNPSLRLGAVLVLRRLKSPQVSLYLNDSDENIATEAARAINDDFSIEEALPALAAALNDGRFNSEAYLRRSINACLRVGGDKELDILRNFILDDTRPETMRAEAIEALSTWASPSVLDRVDGRYRGEINRDINEIKPSINSMIGVLIDTQDPSIVKSTTLLISRLKLSEHYSKLPDLFVSSKDEGTKLSCLKAIQQVGMDVNKLLPLAMKDESPAVRAEALSLLPASDLEGNEIRDIMSSLFARGTLNEQQQFVGVLSKLDKDISQDLLSNLVDDLQSEKMNPGLSLDVMEAVESLGDSILIKKLAGFESADYTEALFGGDRRNGARYFFNNPTGQCTRCHKIRDIGPDVGPALTNIGNTLSREQLLEALVNPSARLAPGYGSVRLKLTDGQEVIGILLEEREDQLILQSVNAEPLEIPIGRIEERQNLPSSMPPMGTLMSKRDLRDLIEFLSGLKN